MLSSLSVEMDTGEGLALLKRRHLEVEEAVERSRMAWTHVRPGMFMTNTLSWAEPVRTDGVVREPLPGPVAAPVHEADIAGVVVAALLDPERHAGAAYALSGPEALSQVDRVRILAEVLGRPVRFEELGRDEARARMLENPWMNERLADSLLALQADAVGVREGLVLPTVADALGRPALDFARWVEDHRDDFTSAA